MIIPVKAILPVAQTPKRVTLKGRQTLKRRVTTTTDSSSKVATVVAASVTIPTPVTVTVETAKILTNTMNYRKIVRKIERALVLYGWSLRRYGVCSPVTEPILVNVGHPISTLLTHRIFHSYVTTQKKRPRPLLMLLMPKDNMAAWVNRRSYLN